MRSVALADVLKLHFEPTDVLTAGIDFNTSETLDMLYQWADTIVVMQQHYRDKIPKKYRSKVLTCEVGPDTYGTPKNSSLIDRVFVWARATAHIMKVKEHSEIL